MEGRLHDFEKIRNTTEKFTEIENRYKTSEGISGVLEDQVQNDYKIIHNLIPNDIITKEKIQGLLDHLKDIYPDVELGSLEETLFPKKDVEKEILEGIAELSN